MNFRLVSFRHPKLVALLVLGISLFPWHNAMAAERLGLHVTQEELKIWKQRATKGPYKTKGDVSLNSPGDWDRILSNANAFLANPSAERWKGQVPAECAVLGSLPAISEGQGQKLRDAGFSYLLTGNTKYRDAVRAELLAQVAEPGTNWIDGTRWCNHYGGVNPITEYNMWLLRILVGYDYIRSSLSAADKNTIEKWFKNAAMFWHVGPQTNVKKRFPGRENDDYTPTTYGLDKTRMAYLEAQGTGLETTGFHSIWNNREAVMIAFVGLTGILVNDDYLKGQAKRWFKEAVKYWTYPNNTYGELYRWELGKPNKGLGYVLATIGFLNMIADHFARIGDIELYDYVTGEGVYGTKGGPKSLDRMMRAHLELTHHKRQFYGTDNRAYAGNPDYLIDLNAELYSWESVADTYVAPANVYYQDVYTKGIYTRTASGVPAYPSSPAGGGIGGPWSGAGGVYPGVLFMFGDMEGKVWPYPTSGDTDAPAPPANLRIQ